MTHDTRRMGCFLLGFFPGRSGFIYNWGVAPNPGYQYLICSYFARHKSLLLSFS
jgi:hypothetical protein